MSKQKICVIGNGLAGLMTAIILSKENIELDLYSSVNKKNKIKYDDRTTAISESNYKYIKKVLLKGILSYLLDKHPELYKDQAYVRFVKNYKKFETMYDQCVEKDYWILQRALPFKADSLGNKL